jgi:hypothetical protein
MNQYDLWGGLEALSGRDGVFVTEGWEPARLGGVAGCSEIRTLRTVETLHRGLPAHHFTISWCRGFQAQQVSSHFASY